MDIKPFFYYYGGKWRCAKKYPPPQYGRIIEPFAGAAGYSVRYHHLEVVLYDASPVICGLWQYLIRVKESEIRGLPLVIDHVNDLKCCQEAKWLLGFWFNQGVSSPRLQPSKWMRSGRYPESSWGETIRERIARQLRVIRHWKIINCFYEDVKDEEATWFIDPPYQGDCGKHYKHGIADYEHLGIWCQNLPGQVLVCERGGANWLPFLPFATIGATNGKGRRGSSNEVLWTSGSNNGSQRMLFNLGGYG